MKILIVDDNERIRKLINKLLDKLNTPIDVIECADGEEAVKIYNEEKPDLILMDIIMKKLDGFSAIRRIRLISPKATIIVVSQLPEQEYRQEALDAGAVDYLNKENLILLPEMIENIFNSSNKNFIN
ncbi:MAG: response regulator transcription factor [Ignavibacteriales bacterium]|nr:response regulator transcription factor [Ignavibacteriales bacterium]